MITKALMKAIYTKFKASATLLARVSGRFFFEYAPPGTTLPYIVYAMESNEPIYYMASSSFESFDLIFSVYSESSSGVEAVEIAELLAGAFDNCSLTVTGGTKIDFKRDGAKSDFDADLGVWVHSVFYDVIID